MRSAIALGFVWALSLATMSMAAEGIWRMKTDMPTPRMYLSTSAMKGRIYAIGGSTGGAPLQTVEEYDPATDAWAAKSSMPTARWGLSTCAVDGKIYAMGGATMNVEAPLRTMEEYDPTTDTWKVKAPMPTPRWGLSAGVVGGRIYAVGGMVAVGVGSRIVEEYDPATDKWVIKTPLNIGRYAHSVCTVNGKICAVGGVLTYPGSTATVEEYDPAQDTWIAKHGLLGAKTYFSACAVNGRIYAFGGAPHPDGATAAVYEYDPATDTCKAKLDMLKPRALLSASDVDGKIYVIGGSTSGYPWSASGLVEEYTVKPLIVDFNGDGIVAIEDLLALIASWGQDDPAVDIGPRPFGDGRIDAADLEVLMSYWGQEAEDPTLLAHWKLDEVSGTTAADSAGASHGVLTGAPAWQPAGGKVGGALQFDGQDDAVTTGFVLDPARGPFSVFAWVKGGMPGQVILAQAGGANWLRAAPTSGMLMTELNEAGRNANKSLLSSTLVTDGAWHRVGLVWDTKNRILYVDGVEVAKDSPANVGSSTTGLQIGAGNTLTPGTFWSGPIDDVRIYDRAVKP